MNTADVTKIEITVFIIWRKQVYIIILCSYTQPDDGFTKPKHVAECAF